MDVPLLFKTQRIKLPKGIAQVGKSFRNEIAPRQGILRLRELYQAEIEVLFNPDKVDLPKFDVALDYKLNIALGDVEPTAIRVSDAIAQGIIPHKLIGYYLYLIQSFYEKVGIPSSAIRLRKLSDDEKAFYSSVAFDLEVRTSVGWLELVACNYRSDYDLRRHAEVSKSDFTVDDEGDEGPPPRLRALDGNRQEPLRATGERVQGRGGEDVPRTEACRRARPGGGLPPHGKGRTA